jgi:hypothetical protein
MSPWSATTASRMKKWWDAWIAEANRRYERLISGEDPGLTPEEFWSDDDGVTEVH